MIMTGLLAGCGNDSEEDTANSEAEAEANANGSTEELAEEAGEEADLSNEENEAEEESSPEPSTLTEEDEPVAVKGDLDADSEIVLVTDYSCPHCQDWYEETYPNVVSDIIDQGEANFRTVPVTYLDENSTRFAELDLSVKKEAPEHYFDIAEQVYADAHHPDNPSWGEESYQREVLEEHGLDYDEVMEADIPDTNDVTNAYGMEYAIESVPTILVDGEIVEDPFNVDDISEKVTE